MQLKESNQGNYQNGSGKIREKSGNLEIENLWEPCNVPNYV